MRAYRALALALVCTLLCAGVASAHRIAVLAFAIVPVGMNDEVLPSPAQVAGLTTDLRVALRARGATVVDVRGSCASAACALRIGHKLHVDRVVYGQVTRYMALLWSMDVASVDVQTGTRWAFRQPYKGDIAALDYDLPHLARQIPL